MSQTSEDYGCVSSIELKPVYISLGVSKALVSSSATPVPRPMFQAAIDGGKQYPDSIWLFRNENCYRFNVKKGTFEDGPVRMAEWWGKNAFPLAYSSYITSAVWGGEKFPDLVYFFQGNSYARYNSRTGNFDINARSMLTPQDWGNARTNWLAIEGPGAAIHAIGAENQGMLHFFRNGQYIIFNLSQGQCIGPMPISQGWALPAPFTEGIDIAFYGTDEESRKIYFVRNQDYALYDTETKTTEEIGKIYEKFPELARFSIDPQLFLVESYTLRSYAGPTEGGEVVDSTTILAGQKKEIEVSFQILTSKTSTISTSILQSGEASIENDFYQQVKDENHNSTSKEKYDYGFKGTFDGEAGATSLTGGEAHAKVSASGATNDVRDEFAKAAFKTVDSQVKSTNKELKSTTNATQNTEETKTIQTKKEVSTLTNDSDHVRTLEFRHQRQKYIALLSLTNVQLAYADGKKPPEIVEIDQIDSLLSKRIPDEHTRALVRSYVVNELQGIVDEYSDPRSIIKEIVGKGDGKDKIYKVDTQVKSSHKITNQNGSEQVLTVDGIVKKANTWLVPTCALIAIEKN